MTEFQYRGFWRVMTVLGFIGVLANLYGLLVIGQRAYMVLAIVGFWVVFQGLQRWNRS